MTRSTTITVRFPANEARHLSDTARARRTTYSAVVRAAVHALTPEGIMEELAARYHAEDGLTIADLWTILGLVDSPRQWETMKPGESVAFAQSILSGRARRVVRLRLEEIVYEPMPERDASGEG